MVLVLLLGVAKATGLRDDDEIRRFQDVTERHSSRFAFPSEMTAHRRDLIRAALANTEDEADSGLDPLAEEHPGTEAN